MPNDRPPYQFPPDYGAYYEESHLRKEYLTRLPEEIAEFMSREWPRVKMHQVRAFYHHAKRAEEAWRRGLPLRDVVNEIQKLVFHANDKFQKGRISATFRDFVERNAKKVTADDNGASLRAFLQHFEALVGFSAGRLSEGRGE